MKEIRVWVKPPGEPAQPKTIPNTLESFQKIVDGHIEAVTLATNLAVICNEEGRMLKLKHNCLVGGVDFVGTIILVGVDGDEFTDCPVKKENIGLWIV